ncbi:MAG: hypothetical protein AAF211_08245, partial [Myxococcota bacterium]
MSVPNGRWSMVAVLSSTACAAGAEDDPGRFYAHYTQLEVEDVPDEISGPYADVVVNVGATGQLVFSRQTSYRPVWNYGGEQSEAVPHLSAVAGDGPEAGRFDPSNQYAHVRILSQDDDEVFVHWRYFPDLADLAPTGVVHETYTIAQDGSVVRTHREGDVDFETWSDPQYGTTQTFRLTAQGIEDLETTEPVQRDPAPALVGAPVIDSALPFEPTARWRFDEGRGESVAGQDGHDGVVAEPIWKSGVSGTALAFDGYGSVVTVERPPPISDAVSVSAWIALSAFPWNTAPIVHHSEGFGTSGYYLGVGPY